ncbi:MAG TPA: 50S ribosomal protein L15 [Dehalococcoidia bacterium]|nr:50S ribosomal protein L15 [Dehalococcoidia bacterium]
MRLDEVRPAPGSRRPRKRVGRGHGSGWVKTAGKGTKGQKARSGGGVRPGFEGGQLPIIKRLPFLRGFTNIWRTEYETVNVADLARFPAGSEVTPEALVAARLVRKRRLPVKILGDGELDRALTVSAAKFTASARQKIEAAGGTVRVIDAAGNVVTEADDAADETASEGEADGASSREA